jgi:hypothetical protein
VEAGLFEVDVAGLEVMDERLGGGLGSPELCKER